MARQDKAADAAGYKVTLVPAASLTPYARNTRTHSDEQIAKIMASITEWGWTNPMLVDVSANNLIVAGHGRLSAALRIYDAGGSIRTPHGAVLPDGMVPIIDCTGWSEAQRQAYAIADNALAEESGWDKDLLKLELDSLAGLNFNISTIGFDPDRLGKLLAGPTQVAEGLTDPDDVPDIPQDPVSRPGDVWLLGNHRLVCGDATSADDVAKCLGKVVPHLMVTDPPYGVEYDADWRNHTSDLGRSARAIGKVENDDRADWREAWALFPGDVAYVWHAGTKAHIVAQSFLDCGFTIRAQIVWAKNNIVISRGHYHSQHEPCFYLVRGGATGHWAGDRKQSTVWFIDKPQKSETGHSAQKPVECMRRPMENNSSVGQVVYEPFMGSGTSIIAAEQIGRYCFGIELNPAYVDVAVTRWQAFTGEAATLEATGQTFVELLSERQPTAKVKATVKA